MVVMMVVTGLAIMPTAQKAVAQDDGTQMCVQSWADVSYVYQYVEEHLHVEAMHLTIDFLGVVRLVDSWEVNVSYWTESGEYVVTQFTIPISDDCDESFDAMTTDSYSWQCQVDLSAQEFEYLIYSGTYTSMDLWYDGESWWIGPFLVTVEYYEIDLVSGYFQLWIDGVEYTKTISCTPVFHPDAASVELATTEYVAGGQVYWACDGNLILDQGEVVYSPVQERDGFNLLAVVTGQEIDPVTCTAYDMDNTPLTGWYSNHGGVQPTVNDYH